MAESLDAVHGQSRVWLHRLALLTVGTTLLLIAVGGVVTSMGAGLAVPDWPTTFGYHMFLFPWSRMVGGILAEHSHRLIGSVVGLLTLTLAAWLWTVESRGWLRWLGLAAVVVVIVQGVLGGLRVVLLERTLAVIHAALAQAFFALVVSLAFFTSEEGRGEWPRILHRDAGRLRHLVLLTVGVVYLQMILGAMLRHTAVGLGVHLFGALLLTSLVFVLGGRILRRRAQQAKLVRPALLLGGLLVAQLILGLGSYWGKSGTLASAWPPIALVTITAAHVATGALMLGTCLVLTLRIHRWLAPQTPLAVREFVSARPADRAGEAAT
jgi:cytochrome c oxidase assembly protein subunit 15